MAVQTRAIETTKTKAKTRRSVNGGGARVPLAGVNESGGELGLPELGPKAVGAADAQLDHDGVNTSARLSQPYRQSAWIRAAIGFVSGEISSRP